MSIAGIASTLFSQLSSLQNNPQTQIRTQFQQLAQDLQAGNLSLAQSDFASLQQSLPAGFSASGSPASQALSALGQDLKAGNLSAAQQDFSNVQTDVQQAASAHHHHHHHSGNSSQQLTDLFSTLGQDLQTGNLTGAQQAYASLQQDLPFLTTASSAPGTAGSVNVSA